MEIEPFYLDLKLKVLHSNGSSTWYITQPLPNQRCLSSGAYGYWLDTSNGYDSHDAQMCCNIYDPTIDVYDMHGAGICCGFVMDVFYSTSGYHLMHIFNCNNLLYLIVNMT
ncbi:unnamed protein product, partial [Urochloa humidicola]